MIRATTKEWTQCCRNPEGGWQTPWKRWRRFDQRDSGGSWERNHFPHKDAVAEVQLWREKGKGSVYSFTFCTRGCKLPASRQKSTDIICLAKKKSFCCLLLGCRKVWNLSWPLCCLALCPWASPWFFHWPSVFSFNCLCLNQLYWDLIYIK